MSTTPKPGESRFRAISDSELKAAATKAVDRLARNFPATPRGINLSPITSDQDLYDRVAPLRLVPTNSSQHD